MEATRYVDCKRFKTSSGSKISVSSSKPFKQAKNALNKDKKEVRTVDYPPSYQMPLIQYLDINYNMMCYMRRHGLTTAAFNTLLYVHRKFIMDSSGITAYVLAKDLLRISRPDKEMQNVRMKLNRLEAKGLVIKLGRSGKGGYLYIPSVKAIEDIENIFK